MECCSSGSEDDEVADQMRWAEMRCGEMTDDMRMGRGS